MKITSLIVAFCCCYPLAAQDAPVRSPKERFEVLPTNTTTATAAYNRTLAGLRTANKNKPCFYFPSDRCIDGRLKPPFPPLLGRDDLGRESGWKHPELIRNLVNPVDYVSWAPSSAVESNDGLVKKYREFASSGAIFGCEGGHHCSFITYATSPTDLLIVCLIPDSQSGREPPLGCFPLAFSDGKQEWIAISYQEPTGIGGPEHDYDLLVFINGQSVESRVLRTVTEGLSAPPLALRVSSSHAGLKGLSEYRISPILDGWREFVRVNVSVDNEGCQVTPPWGTRNSSPPSGAYCVMFSVQLWVNRQNTTSPSDWHRPSDLLEKKYEGAVSEVIRQSLNRLCSAPSWQNQKVLRCN